MFLRGTLNRLFLRGFHFGTLEPPSRSEGGSVGNMCSDVEHIFGCRSSIPVGHRTQKYSADVELYFFGTLEAGGSDLVPRAKVGFRFGTPPPPAVTRQPTHAPRLPGLHPGRATPRRQFWPQTVQRLAIAAGAAPGDPH